MKTRFFSSLTVLYSIVLLTLWSCKTSNKNSKSTIQQIDKEGESLGPYLTTDNTNNTVLCWTAKDASDSLYRVKFAIFDSVQSRFGKPLIVTPSIGCSHSPESMAKVAFKNDGTIITVFARKFENEANPYAGAIYYTLSSDGGKSWAKARFLHSDTSHDYGRNFFDLATLKDGEVAAVWLDGRFGKVQKGSALFFAKTQKRQGFAHDSCLNKSTCECCRTDLLVDKNGKLHVAYRSIQFPSQTMGSQVRDMVYISSADNGKTFRSEQAVSKDLWKIEGCPHSGPSLAVSDNKVNAVWFTAAAGKPGLYFTSTSGSSFGKRTLLSADGRHPQLAAMDKRLLMVSEESDSAPPHMKHYGAGMSSHHEQASIAKVQLTIIERGNLVRSISITDGTFADHHAVIAPQNNKAVIAWIRENNGIPSVYYTVKKIENEE